MRSASLLLAGLALLVGGVAVLCSDLPVRWWLGAVLVLAGLLAKTGGFLITDQGGPVRSAPYAARTRVARPRETVGARSSSGPAIRALPARTRARAVPSSRPTRRAS